MENQSINGSSQNIHRHPRGRFFSVTAPGRGNATAWARRCEDGARPNAPGLALTWWPSKSGGFFFHFTRRNHGEVFSWWLSGSLVLGKHHMGPSLSVTCCHPLGTGWEDGNSVSGMSPNGVPPPKKKSWKRKKVHLFIGSLKSVRLLFCMTWMFQYKNLSFLSWW